MKEIIFLGRGGQGVVLAQEIVAKALFYEGYHVKGFPSFGTERRGAPVKAFLRYSKSEIKENYQIYKGNYYVVFHHSLAKSIPKDQIQVMNTELKDFETNKIKINANEIAMKNKLGSETNPIVNTAMIGALSSILKIVSFDNLKKAICERLPERHHQKNIQAAFDAFRFMKENYKSEKVNKSEVKYAKGR